jgi:hypothetical protein
MDRLQQLWQIGGWEGIIGHISSCHFGGEMNEIIGRRLIMIHGILTGIGAPPNIGSNPQI